MNKKTYDDFGVAIEKLRNKADISYDTIAFGIQRAQSYVYGICNRRTRNLPKDKIMKEFAEFFHVEPEYFYEWRLKRVLEFVNENREFVDHVERQAKKYKKSSTTSDVQKESPESEDENNQEQSA